MLTNDDLKKIGQVVEEKIDGRLKKELRSIKNDINYIRKTLSVSIARFDETDVSHEKRLKKIEDHLDYYRNKLKIS